MKAALLALALTGCAAGDLAVGVAVVYHVTDEVTHEQAHNCMCVPDGRTKQWYWCDANGKRYGDGEYACCFYCEKNCGRMRDTAKPPVPVPLPPQCDLETHCKDKESCVVGDHKCCESSSSSVLLGGEMTTTKRRTFSQRHYLAVIRGNFKVLMRYAIHGEPTAPQARSLVGMSQSQRKRKARELAFFRVKKSVLQTYAAQAETMQARERGEDVVNPWDRHYLTHGDAYQQARKDYRVGERLRPCLGCEECRGYDDGIGVIHCDGSGVIPARSQVNAGQEER